MNKRTGFLFIILLSLIPAFLIGGSKKQLIGDSISTICNDSLTTSTSIITIPEKVGMKSIILKRIDSIAIDGIKNTVYPGCQILVMKDGKTVYDKCFGTYTYEGKEKVTPGTMYDIASLTKTTATLLAIMKLYDEGLLKLTDKASQFLPFLQNTDKENITIQELLFHESGLPGSLNFHRLVLNVKNPALDNTKDLQHFIPLNSKTSEYNKNYVSRFPTKDFTIQVADSFYLHKDIHEAEMKMIANTKLASKTYLYSCINFVLLKEIAENISGIPMDVFLNNEFYSPMNLKNICFFPLRTHKKEDITPTLYHDFLRNGIIQGYVHDPAAAFLGGISGNAGLFATSEDVAAIYQMLLNNGEWNGKHYLSPETCKLFTTKTSASGRRGLGFDKPVPSKPNNNPCSNLAPQQVYGHSGYTGTCTWVDPVNKIVYVFLSNRTFPNDGVNKLSRMGIRTKIQDIIYKSIK
ncbi:MAG: serine hydrolase [Paludibacter sp.]|nr:serine hydrolase [Paludibacter sp.]